MEESGHLQEAPGSGGAGWEWALGHSATQPRRGGPSSSWRKEEDVPRCWHLLKIKMSPLLQVPLGCLSLWLSQPPCRAHAKPTLPAACPPTTGTGSPAGTVHGSQEMAGKLRWRLIPVLPLTSPAVLVEGAGLLPGSVCLSLLAALKGI